jgi:hypothetical protein
MKNPSADKKSSLFSMESCSFGLLFSAVTHSGWPVTRQLPLTTVSGNPAPNFSNRPARMRVLADDLFEIKFEGFQ